MVERQFSAKIEQFKRAGAAVLADDIASPARGILVAPARNITADLVNRVLSLSNALPFVALPPQRVAAFLLESMARPNSLAPSSIKESPALKVCISVEAREGVSTGISAADRAATISILGEEQPNPRKLVKPGHIFPVEVRDGGVLMKSALPEGALDLARAAAETPAALFLDILNAGGAFTDLPGLIDLAARESLPFFTLREIIHHRLEYESLVERVAEAKIPTSLAGELKTIAYRSKIHDGEHLAFIKGEIDPATPVLTRVQPEFTLSDVFGGGHPPSRHQLHRSLEAIGKRGSGVLVYLRRPIQGELKEQVAPSEAHPPGPTAALMREYGVGAQILRDLGVRKIELLTSATRNLAGLSSFGIEVVAQHPIPEL